MASSEKNEIFTDTKTICAAPECRKSRRTCPEAMFCGFPKDPERCKQWVINCGREDLMNKSYEYVFKKCVLCRDHFEDNQFNNIIDPKARLRITAVPTLFQRLTGKRRLSEMQETHESSREKLYPLDSSAACTSTEEDPLDLSREEDPLDVSSAEENPLEIEMAEDPLQSTVKQEDPFDPVTVKVGVSPTNTDEGQHSVYIKEENIDVKEEIYTKSDLTERDTHNWELKRRDEHCNGWAAKEIKEEAPEHIDPEISEQTDPEYPELTEPEVILSESLEEEESDFNMSLRRHNKDLVLKNEHILDQFFDSDDEGSDIGDFIDNASDVDYVQDDHEEEEEYNRCPSQKLPGKLQYDEEDLQMTIGEESLNLLDEDSVNLNHSEISCGKWKKQKLQHAIGLPIQKLDVDSLTARDKSVWNKLPNPALPRLVTNVVQEGSPTMFTSAAVTPAEIFALFLDDVLLSTICVHTNSKIAQLKEKFKDRESLTYRYLDLLELKGFLGIFIMSGMKKDNHVATSEMWSHVHGAPLYRSTMTERRFAFLVRAIRFDDSETRKERLKNDRFAPIRNLWDGVIQHCKENYEPGPHLTVGDQLLGFRGKCIFKIFLPDKPARYGLKIVLLCDAETHYMCNAVPYLGKGSVQLDKPQTLGEFFTTQLAAPYAHCGRTITTNNSFTSLPLALALQKSGLQLIGTIRNSPYIPNYMMSFNMEVDESVAAYNYEAKVTLLCQRVNQTKRVQLLSTIHHDPTVIDKTKTDMQMFYDATKGGVDFFEQLCVGTSCSRKTCRWSLCIFFGIINLVLSNAYIIHSLKEDSQAKTRRCFGLSLAEELCRPWAMKRLYESKMSRDLKTVIADTFNCVYDPASALHITTKAEKRQRCFICPRRTNIKTRLLCIRCQKPVCQRHYVTICLGCHR